MGNEVLKISGLTKVYHKHTVVDHINMTINKGDIYGFIGKNGAGKTTTMRMILTLATPTEGTVELFGNGDFREGCKKTGALIETPSLPKGISARAALERYSILYGADKNKVDEILKLVGLEDAGNRKIGQFSLGMKQRVGIGIALLNDPEFLILDEPLNGLDPIGMKEIRDLIHRLNKENGITFLISSHLLEELEKTATRIGIINSGKMIRECTMEEIVSTCVQKVVFTVDDTKKASEIISSQNPELKDKLQKEESKVYVTCGYENSAKLNSQLVMGGVNVSLVETAGYNLEDYYLEAIGAK